MVLMKTNHQVLREIAETIRVNNQKENAIIPTPKSTFHIDIQIVGDIETARLIRIVSE